jgi:1,4-dihydroxy-2-naphthoyl-CoA hydrolase
MTAESVSKAAQAGSLPELLGFEWQEARVGYMFGRFNVFPHHLASTGYLHAATVVALADSACGFGCLASLPDGSIGFTTIELKTNFIGTVRHGGVKCQARMVHAGRSTQVWDAEVMNETTNKTIAMFRCTQMILYPTQPTSNSGRDLPLL